MGLGHAIAKGLGRALRPVRSGRDTLASSKLAADQTAPLQVWSNAFGPGEELPRSATVDGVGGHPPIGWKGVPPTARSIALLCEDPDAPMPRPYVHWVLYGIPARDGTLDAATQATARTGKNSKGRTGYAPAAPPPGHGRHSYHFQVFALDRELSLPAGARRSELLDAMRGHVVGWGDLVGTYERR